jgi:glycosyltransferase involved in cell wall biosynthesis
MVGRPPRQVRVAVDLTGQRSAGVSPEVIRYTRTLLRRLRVAGPESDLLLLTSAGAPPDFSATDGFISYQLPVRQRMDAVWRSPATFAWLQRLRDHVPLRSHLRKLLTAATPVQAVTPSDAATRPWRRRPPRLSLLREQGAEVLFCPLTAPGFHEPGIPLVSLIHDLQFEAYPEFFTSEELHTLRTGFANACWLADRLICNSAFVRQAVLDASTLPEERVVTITPRLVYDVQSPTPEIERRTLSALGLNGGDFLLYPADFSPAKNHAMLFTALGIFRARQPEAPLKLVCAGELDARAAALREAARRMGLERWIIFPGEPGDAESAVLLKCCTAIIYASLYEGSGLAILNAMRCGKPVLCSNTTALPEVAQDAAIYFDPRRPDGMARAIERAAGPDDALRSLSARGSERATALMHHPGQTAEEYLALFREVAGSRAGSAFASSKT